MKKVKFYIRLLGYKKSCEFIDWFTGKFDTLQYSYSNITTGGVSVQCYDSEFNKCVEWLENCNHRYEISVNHPTEVTKNIIEQLKKDGTING